MQRLFPMIDPVATGHNIQHLRKEKGLSVKDIQGFFNFDDPRAIYKWQSGQSLPTVDNLYALSFLLGVPIDRIIIGVTLSIEKDEPQDDSCGPACFWALHAGLWDYPLISQPAADSFPPGGSLSSASLNLKGKVTRRAG